VILLLSHASQQVISPPVCNNSKNLESVMKIFFILLTETVHMEDVYFISIESFVVVVDEESGYYCGGGRVRSYFLRRA
jgi:hypothetical protein